MGVKFGTEEGTLGPLLTEEGTLGPLLLAKFHCHRCNVSPLRGEIPQNWALSKRNTGRFALRAMLPVIKSCSLTVSESKVAEECNWCSYSFPLLSRSSHSYSYFKILALPSTSVQHSFPILHIPVPIAFAFVVFETSTMCCTTRYDKQYFRAS